MDAIELLRQGSQLHQLEMAGGFFDQFQGMPPAVIVHHALQILRIQDPSILGLLQAPSLTKLEIIGCIICDDDQDEFETVCAFLTHSPILETITITIYWLDMMRIHTDFSPRIANLRRLELSILCDVDPEYCGRLVFYDLKLVPLTLAQLTINGGNIHFGAKDLVDIIIYHKTAGSSLWEVTLHCSRFILSDVERKTLHEMKEDGLNIEIYGM